MGDYRELELTNEKVQKLRRDDTDRLGHVLETLEEADEIAEGVDWGTELWENCTVEEVIGALVEAGGK